MIGHPAIWLRRAVGALPGAALAVGLGAGCGVSVSGNFDGVPFTPDSTILAVADRQDLLLRNGAVVPVKKNRAQQTLQVLLTAARLEIGDDWRRQTASDILEIKRDLATSDGIFLKDVPLDRFEDGHTLRAQVKDGFVTGDFDVAVGAALPEDAFVAAQGLGSKLQITINPVTLEAGPRGGSIHMQVEIQREREAGQDGDVATGTVSLELSAGLSPERLSESNLTLAAPVLFCMQQVGPARAGTCRDVEELPYVDETGIVEP